MTLEQIVKEFIAKNKLNFPVGKEEKYIKDFIKSTQLVGNGEVRTTSGNRVDANSYLLAMAETGLYGVIKPSTRTNYVSSYPVRSDGMKTLLKKESEAYFKKTFAVLGYKFESDEIEDKIIDVMSGHFLPSDSEDGEPRFRKISDTETGTHFSKESYTLESSLNQVGASRFVDNEGKETAFKSRMAALREKAVYRVPAGSKPSEIEKEAQRMYEYEKKKELRVGKIIPPTDTEKIQEEFYKRLQLNGTDRTSALASARIATSKLDDLSSIKAEISKIQKPNNSSTYNFKEE